MCREGTLLVDVKVARPDRPKAYKVIKNVLIDSRTINFRRLSVIPSGTARELRIPLRRRERLERFDDVDCFGERHAIVWRIGTALFSVENRWVSDDFVASDDFQPLLSLRALEGMGLRFGPDKYGETFVLGKKPLYL